jgi:hypothetical protein
MIRLPTWLYLLLLWVVFLGTCMLSIRPIWEWRDRARIRPVREADKAYFPVLARTADGKYVAAPMGELPSGTILVLSVTRDEERKINRDLGKSIDRAGEYRYFEVLSEEHDAMNVSLEVPTISESKRKGWYSMKRGSIEPQNIVSYGPGFAFLVLPWTLLAGLGAVAVCRLVVRGGGANCDANGVGNRCG